MNRVLAMSDSPYHERIGFSRAVRTGPVVTVSGTAPIGKDGALAPDVAGQVRRALEIVGEALEKVGARLDHVTRTRVMMRDITRWQEAAKIHGEFFGRIRPAATFVEVSRFIDPNWLVEIEADAYIHDGGEDGRV
ncbi:MAG: RidA family protein [Alphaproteobacteria bacterium]|nr:RidA family protein [Alphaproteobacteria bacterium]MBN9593611.1 RidA family protein [Alphaproteobacteria bacterium]